MFLDLNHSHRLCSQIFLRRMVLIFISIKIISYFKDLRAKMAQESTTIKFVPGINLHDELTDCSRRILVFSMLNVKMLLMFQFTSELLSPKQ